MTDCYNGQRYEISYYCPEADRRVLLGWANSMDAARKMLACLEKVPRAEYPWITDLFANEQHGGHPEGSMVVPNAIAHRPVEDEGRNGSGGATGCAAGGED